MYLGIPTLHKIDHNEADISIIYNSCNHVVLQLDKDTAYNIKNYNDLVERLSDNNLNFDKSNWLKSVPATLKLNNTFNIKNLYLILSSKCNLKCEYCFQSTDISNQTNMPNDIIDRALSEFSKHINYTKKNNIVFYGGEPLMNPNGLFHSIDRIIKMKSDGEIPTDTSISIVTNGTLLNEKIIKYLKKGNCSVSISLDGNEESNLKRFSSDSNRFSITRKNIQLIKEFNVPLFISCTAYIDPEKSLLKRIKWIVQEIAPSKIGLNIPQYNDNYIFDENKHENICKEITTVYEYFISKGIQETYLTRILTAFFKHNVLLNWCGSYGQQIVINPSGELLKCQRYSRSVNGRLDININDSNWYHKLFSSRTFQNWSQYLPINNTTCYDCIGFGICGGGHRCNLNAITKDFSNCAEVKDYPHCIYIKTIAKWILERIITNINK